MVDARRSFMRQMASVTVGSIVAPIGALYANEAEAMRECEATNSRSRGFGALRPMRPANTQQLGDIISGNLVNREILSLPEGFSYTVVSGVGQIMNDGNPVPAKHDGMAAFQQKLVRNGREIYSRAVHLVRNHEIDVGQQLFGVDQGVRTSAFYRYDLMVSAGGATTVVVDSRTGLVRRHNASLSGTVHNCAGGRTPWNTWISCEEDVQTPTSNPENVSKKHGYNFELSAFTPQRRIRPLPLKDMGRFRHEAAVTDPRTTNVFQTEDRPDSCFYAFVPRIRNRAFGHLIRGGALYAMAIRLNQRSTCNGERLPVSRLNGRNVVDTRTGMQAFLGQPLKVAWVKIDEPDPESDTVRREAQSKGASVFRKGEGLIFDEEKGLAYFCASQGGDAELGQIWCYDPVNETVTLVLESVNKRFLALPDNIVVGPDKTLYVCEDNAERAHVVGIGENGKTFRMVENLLNRGELTGVCFSQDSGLTCCIYRDDRREISVGV